MLTRHRTAKKRSILSMAGLSEMFTYDESTAPGHIMPKSPEKTGKTVKAEAGEGLSKPGSLTKKQVQSLAGSVASHIKPRDKAKGRG